MRLSSPTLSIRARIVLLALAILLPAIGMLAWLLADYLRQAREAAYANVRILATATAADVERFLRRSHGVLDRLAARPLVAALDPTRCDPLVAEFVAINTDFASLGIRGAAGHVVCSTARDPIPDLRPEQLPWFRQRLQADGLQAGDAMQRTPGGRWLVVMTHPLYAPSGTSVGLLELPVDLLNLGEQLLASVPQNAVVTVVDRQRAVLLRSTGAAAFVGQRLGPADADPLRGPQEGFVSESGRDGVPRLVAFVTVPDVGWRVVAGLPEAEVFAEYRATLRRTALITFGLAMLALLLAWNVSGALARLLAARDAAVAALGESEQRYRTLVDWSPEAISVHRDGKVLFANRATVELLGAHSDQELVGRPSIDFIHPDFRGGVAAEVDAAVTRGQTIARQEQRFVRLDGQPVDVEVQGTAIVFSGAPAMIASMRDITPRKQAEAALQRSEARLQGIFASASDAIITTDDSQRIVMANPAAATMFRCPLERLIGAPIDSLMPERSRSTHRRGVQEFGEGETAARHMGRTRDVTGLRADGEEFPLDAAISRVAVGGQRLFTVILRDVSERRRIETALRDSEAHQRRLLAALPVAVFVDRDDRINFVNEAAERLFGAPAEALLGRSPLTLIHLDSVELVRSRIAALRGGGGIAPLVQVKIVRADGGVHVVEALGVWIEEQGGESILVVMRDVTELAQAQSALARSHADLRRLFAAHDRVQEEERKRIARELHDDLQQTLAAMRINLSAAGERLAADPTGVPPLLAEVDRLAGAAIVSTRRIVNDLRPPILEDLGLVPALQLLADEFRRRTGIDCRLDPDDTDETDVGSAAATTCLYRIAQESLNNVMKHAHATRVSIGLAHSSDEVRLRIEDDGIGFDTLQPQGPRMYGLLGMHERIRALGGVLHITSRPGAGTKIEARVPAAGVERHADEPSPGIAAGVRGTDPLQV